MLRGKLEINFISPEEAMDIIENYEQRKNVKDEVYIVFSSLCFPSWNRRVMWNGSHTSLSKLEKHIQDLVKAGMVV